MMNPTLRRLGKTGQWRWAPIATLTSSSLVRTRAQLERGAHSMKSPTDLLFTRDGTFAGLRGRNLSPRRQWRPSLPQETVLRGRLCESDFACDCAASSTSRGRAGRVSRKSRYSQQRRKGLHHRLDHTRCCFELPRTREPGSPLEWQRKIPHTRNRGRVTANDNLRG